MTIIKTVAELKENVEVAASLGIATVRPSITTAELRHLRPCLGQQLYTELLEAYETASGNVSNMPENLRELAKLSQRAVSNIAMNILSDRLSVSVSEAGITRTESEARKTAFQYQEVNLKESYIQVGFDGLDDILGYLEENKADFAQWTSSPAYTDYKKYFIQSAEQFSGYFNIQQSRLAFLAVRYIMKRIEDFQVRDIIGKNLFNSLKTQLKAGTVTQANQVLLDDYIRPGVALVTIAKGVWERALDISEKGVTISSKGSTDNNQLRQAADLAKQQKMADQLLADGNEYLSRLGVFLGDNPDDYPEYEAPQITGRLFTINNTRDSGIYGV